MSVNCLRAASSFSIAYTREELTDRNTSVRQQFQKKPQSTAHSSWYQITKHYQIDPMGLSGEGVDALIWKVLVECRTCAKNPTSSIKELERLLDDLFDQCDEETYDKVLKEIWYNANHVKEKVKNEGGSISYRDIGLTKNASLIELLRAEEMAVQERSTPPTRNTRKKLSVESQKTNRSCLSCLPNFRTAAKCVFIACLFLGSGLWLMNNRKEASPLSCPKLEILNPDRCSEFDPELMERVSKAREMRWPTGCAFNPTKAWAHNLGGCSIREFYPDSNLPFSFEVNIESRPKMMGPSKNTSHRAHTVVNRGLAPQIVDGILVNAKMKTGLLSTKTDFIEDASIPDRAAVELNLPVESGIPSSSIRIQVFDPL